MKKNVIFFCHLHNAAAAAAGAEVDDAAGFLDNKAFLLEVLLNHFAGRDSQIQQVIFIVWLAAGRLVGWLTID